MEGVEQEAGAARSGGGLSRVGYGGVDCVVGCDGVGGVVGSGTSAVAAALAAWATAVSIVLDTLHLPLRSCLAFRDGLSS